MRPIDQWAGNRGACHIMMNPGIVTGFRLTNEKKCFRAGMEGVERFLLLRGVAVLAKEGLCVCGSSQ